jgi:copper chaperone CopZ
MITVHVPAMTARQDVRAISAVISDVPGVRTLRADLATGTVQVTGSADPAAITAAVTAAGYPGVDYTVASATDGSPPTGTTRTGSSGAQTRRHHRSEDVRSTPTLDHSPDTHHCRSRRSS